MRIRFRRRPDVAIVLICSSALLSLYVFLHLAWQTYFTTPRCPAEQCMDRYEPLGELLPAATVTGFLADQRHLDPEAMPLDARLYLAQYALSPRRLVGGATSRWVIVDSDCPETTPEVAASSHWILSADLRNGVRLYRTR
jgi:hypothetical protein